MVSSKVPAGVYVEPGAGFWSSRFGARPPLALTRPPDREKMSALRDFDSRKSKERMTHKAWRTITVPVAIWVLAVGAAMGGEAPKDESASDVLVSILPVVGSTPGNFGSYFKTAIQVFNPNATGYSFVVVFHPGGVSGSPSDPSAFVYVAAGETFYFADLLPAIEVATGLGSLDVFIPAGETRQAAMTARVYNDAGVKTVTKAYAPNFFQQTTLDSFLGGATVVGNESLTIQMTAGEAIIYGATVDNLTNDSSLGFAQ